LDISVKADIDEINSFEYSFEFEKIVLEIDLSNSFASEKFSRDYLQSLVNVVMQFNQLNEIDNLPSIPETTDLSVTEQRLSNLNALESGKYIVNEPVTTPKDSQLITPSFYENLKFSNQRYSNEMRLAILNYQSNIVELLGKSGYSIPKLNLSGDDADA
jgi:hypothetical protein